MSLLAGLVLPLAFTGANAALDSSGFLVKAVNNQSPDITATAGLVFPNPGGGEVDPGEGGGIAAGEAEKEVLELAKTEATPAVYEEYAASKCLTKPNSFETVRCTLLTTFYSSTAAMFHDGLVDKMIETRNPQVGVEDLDGKHQEWYSKTVANLGEAQAIQGAIENQSGADQWSEIITTGACKEIQNDALEKERIDADIRSGALNDANMIRSRLSSHISSMYPCIVQIKEVPAR